MTVWNFLTRMLTAVLLGALIGMVRQWSQKSAGLRTNTLLAAGSATYTLISKAITSSNDRLYMGDATRIIGQIVTGIGFFGGGLILRDGLNVQGLNTAATIWCSAAVGALAGTSMYFYAAITALTITLTDNVFRSIGRWINRYPTQKQNSGVFLYTIFIKCKEHVENIVRVRIVNFVKKDHHLKLRSLSSADASPSMAAMEALIVANGNHHTNIEQLAGQLTLEYGVTEVEWKADSLHEV
ncbi:methyltransferase [Thermaurantimonas aggregans]|uniref:Protein MgtC n=1 Tax=Thermaurantimonas aggregans TaxID=2173829 RepID=A0A401XNW3_9FLAO|nr:MgtC/SapB family protein [Thermaurantimonas aggregans]MCX8148865.1 MgtC/SapB family protein [Thermaurantimonas aggregans]GCD78682.1 methyltransferase [Thermaurantimonas aggregans]